jgi:carbonic anhydrase/acetyltransferase-like protein (isoleucine patch superfamily)
MRNQGVKEKIVINTTYPVMKPSVFIAETATVIGEVKCGDNVGIWYGARIRGDLASISIGEGSNIQDNAVIHVDIGIPVVIGSGVTVGHSAVIHGATVEDDVLIGMGAIILNKAKIGRGSIIAAGTLVREGQIIPPGSLVAGLPGRILKEVSPEQLEHLRLNAQLYIRCAEAHKKANKKAKL